MKADFLKHGWTLGCNRCRAMQKGNRKATGMMHSDACRKRIYQAMQEAGDPKLIRAMEQNPEFLERAIKSSPSPMDDPGLEEIKRESLDPEYSGSPIPRSEEDMEHEVEHWLREFEKDPVTDVVPNSAPPDESRDPMDVSRC